MQSKKETLTVRLLGFSPLEGEKIGHALAHAPAGGPSYFCLHGDSLQDPDLSIANGEDLTGLAVLLASNPSTLQPALIIGGGSVAFPFPQLKRPLDQQKLFAELAKLAEARSAAIAALPARLPVVHERRRRIRLDLDVTDPKEYISQRREPARGAVLIVEKGGALRDHVANLLAQYRLSIEWTDSAATAARLCEETPVSVVIINTSTPNIDPYELCEKIKRQRGADRVAVVMLVNRAFGYDTARAREAGERGLLDKPVADRHLIAVLKKLLSIAP